MKPNNIILLRHGESDGNVDKAIYAERPDYTLDLTEKGKKQADHAGEKIAKLIGSDDKVQFYCSNYWRTRRTYEYVAKHFKKHSYYEDPRLREQEWGHLQDRSGLTAKLEEYRDNYGHFHYRFEDGESCADVFDRASDFLSTLHRDFQKVDFAPNTIIVSHGKTIRVMLMRWFHMSVEEFEMLKNPKNCEFFVLTRQSDDRYKLMTELRKYDSPTHPYQYKWETK